ncbi:DNA-directed DNA polymerase [Scheffersomyces stipitis CBS 6054]|uniref:DNA-directed DNA polymerase n=1 Tax=Scheffersomyces stipitis (strain ATCC 58785 / CBS 6054 / NBRC 10063 / NRRL Y-11545) TaxID=322104 RepID=A3LNR5_PICST|nr:DNA-directed DNA polymerase [Scheffersomyces stipitis CBS 6054]ABN64909.2 DNA-directed DNA polymerase [Scheffersomyces stipitis CBS 6054]
MASYTVNSTKSYMQAMQPMIEMLNSLTGTSVSESVTRSPPSIDNENVKITPLDKILGQFEDVSTDLLDQIGIGGPEADNAAVLREIEQECSRISKARGQDSNEILAIIKTTLSDEVGEEQLQSSLFDILGFEEFELIGKIVQNKQVVIGEKQQDDIDTEPKLLTAAERAQLLIDNHQKTKNQKLAPKSLTQQYPNVFKNPDVGNMISVTGKKFSLPVGTTRESHATHEEIIIPYPEQKANRWISDSNLVKVSQLDFLCQGTFKNYQTLNKMQSLVYPVAYNTNENMLVCAPTGAGKTDVALLTILHCINQFVTETVSDEGDVTVDIDYDEFKIVYVAPLKALAAEIVEKYSKKLQWLGINVRELTGDMQLSRAEIMTTQIIVTTPEKWDVVTRKSNGDSELVSKVKLLIIDEVHLLHEDRGSVIETLVARTLRQVESSQQMIRVIGLSATLPNFMDVADFLGVNRNIGMFYFDQTFRPVPLQQQLIGVRGKSGSKIARENIDKVSYEKLADYVNQGLQVMVFVHSRKDTVKSARTFIQIAQDHQELGIFDTSGTEAYQKYSREVSNKNRNKDMKELFQNGFGVHHAGMLRTDRNLTERMFESGAIKVLCCTATLAWGVNLPAAVVIVKGTQVYDSKQGGFIDLGISDVIQIFGRAGRPQYEKFGTGILCTTSDKLDHYVSLITQQHPIESKLAEKITDNLNAEISLGTVTNIDEGVQWLGYTYMMVRMRQNPFAYGIDWKELKEDPLLTNRRREMIITAARRLHYLQMIIFEENSGSFTAKDLGRIASDFYLLNNSVEIFNQMLNPKVTEADVLSMISMSSEFDSIKFREEESEELKKLLENDSPCQIAGDVESTQGKTNILLQAFVSQATIKDSALISDSNYVAQNSARICRALLLVGINRRWGTFMKIMLSICKSIDKRIWAFEHPLSQFDLPETVLRNIRAKNPSMETLRDMESAELGDLVHNNRMGNVLYKLVGRFPYVDIFSEIFPITSNVMRVHVSLEPDFVWDERYHGNAQIFWLTVEESDQFEILHVEKFILNKKQMRSPHEMDFMIPLTDPLPPQIIVRLVSDSWIGSESVHAISFQHLIRPSNETLRTNLLKLQPLPITALHNPEVQAIYDKKFRYFNPMQTMTFHSLYNDNSSVFVGSPTGSGKTVVAELAIWHAFKQFPGSKVVYIAPMKALVRERVDDWRARICKNTSYKLVELTGDSLPEAKEVREADIIITTPEKFDGISRNWQTRKFVQQVSLVIMDEIHLLASDRGPILEMIVSRMNYISSQTKMPIRLLGMSTAVSNAFDMAGWLGVKQGLFNFSSSVRPVPLQMYIDGFPDNLAFCPLMKTMNKPAFMAIKQHSPSKPVLIFVASRRQTRLTALDLIHLCGMESDPRRFLKMPESELEEVLADVKDDTLRLSLQFGMGLHHAGLVESDRQISHKLFEAGKIQILIATSTLAWGVNLPAHLVIIKGTQFFDSKIEAYRDMDLTDILQMMGRAGRPAFDTSGIAIVYTKESKKMFYKHFLNVGFPVESSLHKVLDNHIGAEISAGTISTRQEAMDFLTWTFLYRRAHNNPTYYGIEDTTTAGVSQFLSDLIDDTIENLMESKCVLLGGKDELIPTAFLHISSYYYLSHKTIRNAANNLKKDSSFRDCLRLLCEAAEYDELATRHGEELINMEMSQAMRFPAEDLECEYIWDPHVKAYLLIQAFISRVELPIADYAQDTVSVLDQALRILQALVDTASELGYLTTVLNLIELIQCLKQRYWFDDDPISALPGLHVFSSSENSRTDLEALGKMNTGKLFKFAETIGVKGSQMHSTSPEEVFTDDDAKKEFVRIASHLPTGELFTSQRDSGSLKVEIVHNNYPLNKEFKMYCPHFPKMQRESWFIIVCDEVGDELLLIKRSSPIMSSKKGVVSCSLDIPDDLKGREVTILCVNDAVKISYSAKVTLGI